LFSSISHEPKEEARRFFICALRGPPTTPPAFVHKKPAGKAMPVSTPR
jgi:hypothetical protein